MATIKSDASYKSGYIDVSDGHSLYFELYGNPNGIPVLFLHGGPGAGFSEKDKQFFNKKYQYIHRTGASRPSSSRKGSCHKTGVLHVNVHQPSGWPSHAVKVSPTMSETTAPTTVMAE